MIELLIWILICVFAIWQSVEICHHSLAGTLWRKLAEYFIETKWLRYLGDGMVCPFCYSNWFGMLYVGLYAYMIEPFSVATVITFCGGLAAARGANMMNDWMHYPGAFISRTPNKNPNSGSEQIGQLLDEDRELIQVAEESK